MPGRGQGAQRDGGHPRQDTDRRRAVQLHRALRNHRRAENRQRIIHVRWSGEACWIPLGDLDLGLGYENHTSYPAPGQMLLYPGGISETEILLAYGAVQFASKMGQLAGNHFLTIEAGGENLAALGKTVLWDGAQDIVFG